LLEITVAQLVLRAKLGLVVALQSACQLVDASAVGQK